MSVETDQHMQGTQANNRLDSVYQKFKKAQQNMSDFKQLLTKFSTHRKNQTSDPQVKQFEPVQQPSPLPEQATSMKLSEGWRYSGETFEGKFHGYGILIHNDHTVYSGDFVHGRMHGKGKLYYHQSFAELINIGTSDWAAYEGEFKDGQICGFGNLILENQSIICGYWNRGTPRYFTKLQSFKSDL